MFSPYLFVLVHDWNTNWENVNNHNYFLDFTFKWIISIVDNDTRTVPLLLTTHFFVNKYLYIFIYITFDWRRKHITTYTYINILSLFICSYEPNYNIYFSYPPDT